MALDDAVTIEPIRAERVENFHRALDAVSRERKYLTFLEAPPLEAVRAFILDMIEHGHPQFVAVVDSEVIDWCDIRHESRPSHAHRGILDIGILPLHRDRGLGARLLRRTLDAARELGLHRVELSVHADNTRAIALYEKIGFVHEWRARDAVLINGRYIDSLNMAIIFGN